MKKNLIENRKAGYKYQVLDTLEAGIVLEGAEAKNLRLGRGSVQGAYASLLLSQSHQAEIWLIGSHIEGVDDPARSRKLLLHRSQINKLVGIVQAKNNTLVPLNIYSSRGKIKLTLGIAKGKKTTDRREEIKKRDSERQIKDFYHD